MVDMLKKNWYNNHIIGALYMTAFFMVFLSKKKDICTVCTLMSKFDRDGI